MKPFSYVTARSAESATDLVKDHGRFIAGGMDLLGELKEGLDDPSLLVNIKSVPGTQQITLAEGKWTLGATVRLSQIAEHAELNKALPGLVQAAEHVGSPQMRNVATVGGNLAQHSRCWYYRHRDVKCLKKGGARCFARGGQNKFHALFASKMCLSPCVSNLAVALSALDASVIVQRGKKQVALTVAQLYEAAWSNPKLHHSLGTEDLILRVEIPVVAGQRSTYLQVSERNDFDWALVSCAAAGRLEGGKLRGVKIALGCVAPIPWKVEAAEKALEGAELNEASLIRAAEAMLQGATAYEQNGYKIPLAKALVRRAVAALSGA
jgi:xanthine dehydrogenase YagS FAD-binding subunit